eukprot:CAMPEP_0181303326 /NCGR_PEP_ID=MMETSP1101-20121128/8493_1 /TAXON_ID=46948 /ORGANISM="Rhodomonas abbreviata, Strain Caron Lab Isolate" /LENGTH=110 /DNA_ID=CAMNT_0023408881 /DNA_START=135 /DNA_END=467 /DNA_ORIENTATION=+
MCELRGNGMHAQAHATGPPSPRTLENAQRHLEMGGVLSNAGIWAFGNGRGVVECRSYMTREPLSGSPKGVVSHVWTKIGNLGPIPDVRAQHRHVVLYRLRRQVLRLGGPG